MPWPDFLLRIRTIPRLRAIERLNLIRAARIAQADKEQFKRAIERETDEAFPHGE